MRVVAVERTMDADIADVYRWLADARNYRRVPGCLKVDVWPGPNGDVGPGTVRTVTTALLRVTEEVTTIDPAFRIEYRITSSTPPIIHDGGSVILRESLGGGTSVRWTSRFEVALPVLGRLLSPLVAMVMATGFRLTLGVAKRELAVKQ